MLPDLESIVEKTKTNANGTQFERKAQTMGFAWNANGKIVANIRINPAKRRIVNACDPSRISDVTQLVTLQHEIQMRNERQITIPKHAVVRKTTIHTSLVRRTLSCSFTSGWILRHLQVSWIRLPPPHNWVRLKINMFGIIIYGTPFQFSSLPPSTLHTLNLSWNWCKHFY